MTKIEALRRLRAHETELRGMGIQRLSIFGSVARGDDHAGSDVDLAVELRPDLRIGVFAFLTMEERVAALMGEKVDLVLEPHGQAPRLQAQIDRDRIHVF